MIATDMTTGGSLEERLRWAFKMFDKDGSGKVKIIIMIKLLSGLWSGRIEKHEMEEIISILFELNGFSAVILLENTASPVFMRTIQNKSKHIALQLFYKLDVRCTGQVAEEDFIAGCLADPSIGWLVNY